MKKKFLLLAVMIMALACLLMISASAADSINPSTSNEFGTLTTFDEAFGNTKISPNKDDGTIARAVLFDGTSYYTVPTYYILTESTKSTGEMMLMSFSEINSKMSKSFSKNSIIRFEMPSDIDFIANNMETFNGAANMVEVKLNRGLNFWDNGTPKAFANCKALKEIDISMINLCYANSTFSLFEYCENLEKVILPDAFVKDGKPLSYSTDYMFNGCKKLTTIENMDSFFVGTKGVNSKMFMDCKALTEIKLWNGIETIGSNAFMGCSAITSIVFPNTVTTIGTNTTVFASCTSLKKIVLPSGPVSLGDYCFEKCTALTDVWMPSGASTFGKQVFGQCGADLQVNFYFTTATNTITVTNTDSNKDPYIKAVNNGDARLKFNTPLSTKCSVFFGGHTKPASVNDCRTGGNCVVCAAVLEGIAGGHVFVETLTFPNGLTADGIYTCDCTNSGCTVADILAGDEQGRDVVPAIFTAKGYSTNPEKNSINGGYSVNLNSLLLHKRLIGEIKYGVVIANANSFDGEFFDEDNKVNTTKSIQTEIDSQYSNFSVAINFGSQTGVELDLVICAYVVTGDGVIFIQKDTGDNVTIGNKAFKCVNLAMVVALTPDATKENF